MAMSLTNRVNGFSLPTRWPINDLRDVNHLAANWQARIVAPRAALSSPNDECLDQKDLKINIAGALGQVGTLDFYLAGQLVESTLLPPAEWAVVALLAQTAKEADGQSPDDYLSAQQLANQLRARELIIRFDADLAIRAVSRLRSRLRRLPLLQLLRDNGLIDRSEDFGTWLIERHPLCGYRINPTLTAVALKISESSDGDL